MQAILEAAWVQLALKIALTGIIILVLGGLCWFLISLIQRSLKVIIKREHTFSLSNMGNVASTYHLHVESPEPLFIFQLSKNKIPLAEAVIPVEEPPSLIIKPFSKPADISQTVVTPTNQTQKSESVGLQPGAVLKSPGKAGEKMVAKSGAAASLLGTIGGLLPGSLGKSLKEQSAAVRNVQTKTKDAMDQPQAMQRKLDQMNKDTGKLGVKATTASIPSANKSTSSEADQKTTTAPTPITPMINSNASGKFLKVPSTETIYPGEKMELTLSIYAKKPTISEGSYLYTIKSQQVPLEKFDKEIPPAIKQGVVHFRPANIWRIALPHLLSGVLILAGLLAIFFFVPMLWA